MTREEWLRLAVEKIDSKFFNGALDLLNHSYQISTGITMWNKSYSAWFPYDGENPTMDDFFPPSIIINQSIKDPVEILEAVTLACVRVFFNHKREDKKFRKQAEDYYFDIVDKKVVASDYLKSILKGIYTVLVRDYGDYPGKPVVEHKKDKKETEKKKGAIKMFCPDCDYQLKVARRVYEKYGQKCPTCVCGAKMTVDLSDEEDSNDNN